MGWRRTPAVTANLQNMKLREVRRSAVLAISFLLLVLVLSACLPGENPAVRTAAPDSSPAGLIRGIWHGIVAPFSFVISLFTDTVNVYEVRNNGNWYDFGFVLGAGILFGGSGVGARRRRR